MQVGVANLILGNVLGQPDHDGILVARVAENIPRPHERFEEHDKRPAVRWLQNFAEVTIRRGDDVPHRQTVSRGGVFIPRLKLRPGSVQVGFLVKIRQDFAESLNLEHFRRELIGPV